MELNFSFICYLYILHPDVVKPLNRLPTMCLIIVVYEFAMSPNRTKFVNLKVFILVCLRL